MKEFKWQKEKIGKFIKYLGVLNIFFTILLSSFANSSKVYASVYKTGTSDHYSIQVSQLASGREEIIVSWHNLYEGQYYDYVDLVSIRCSGSNGNNYTYYLCLHGTDEMTIKFPSTDLTNITVTTVQYWEFTDYNLSQLGVIVNRLNSIITSVDTNTSNIQTMTQYVSIIMSEFDVLRDVAVADYNLIDIYQYNAFSYLFNCFPGYLTATSNLNSPYPVVRPFTVYGRSTSYSTNNSLVVFPNTHYILIVGTHIGTLYNYTSYDSPDYSSNDNIEVNYRWRRITNDFYLTGFRYKNDSANNIYFHHIFSTVPPTGYKIYPLYWGPFDECPYLSLLEYSNSSATALDNQSSTIDNLSDTTESIENQFNTDFNDNLDNIDIDSSSNIISQNNLVNSANWVKNRFNELTINNPFGDILSFSLIFGLALLLIGRIL